MQVLREGNRLLHVAPDGGVETIQVNAIPERCSWCGLTTAGITYEFKDGVLSAFCDSRHLDIWRREKRRKLVESEAAKCNLQRIAGETDAEFEARVLGRMRES